MPREELKQLITEAVKEAGYHACPLHDIGITCEIHKDHHRFLASFFRDMRHMRTAFLAGVVTTMTGGLLGILWWFFSGRN